MEHTPRPPRKGAEPPACCANCPYYSPEDADSGWCNCHGGWRQPTQAPCDDHG